MEKMTVYIMDSEPIMLYAMEALLTPLSAQAVVIGKCADVQAGLAEIGHLKPDILFLDDKMKTKNGERLSEDVFEQLPNAILVTISSANLQDKKAVRVTGPGRICITKSEICEESLRKLMRMARQEFGTIHSREKEPESFFLAAVRVDESKATAGENPFTGESGLSGTLYGRIGSFCFYLVEEKAKWSRIGAEILQKLAFWTDFQSRSRWDESRMLQFQELVMRYIFYQKKQPAQIVWSWMEQSEKSDMAVLDFPQNSYQRLLQRREFQAAGERMACYLEQARIALYDPELLKRIVYENVLCFRRYIVGSKHGGAWIMRSQILQADCFERLKQLWQDWYTEWIAEEKGSDEQQDLELILSYVEQNYYEALSLEQIAERFHYSYNYLSAMFGRYTKRNFTDYLNLVRIRKAEGMLKNRSIRISAVADMAGYSSHGYFSRTFKKYTGCSPSEYREKESKKMQQPK